MSLQQRFALKLRRHHQDFEAGGTSVGRGVLHVLQKPARHYASTRCSHDGCCSAVAGFQGDGQPVETPSSSSSHFHHGVAAVTHYAPMLWAVFVLLTVVCLFSFTDFVLQVAAVLFSCFTVKPEGLFCSLSVFFAAADRRISPSWDGSSLFLSGICSFTTQLQFPSVSTTVVFLFNVAETLEDSSQSCSHAAF